MFDSGLKWSLLNNVIVIILKKQGGIGKHQVKGESLG